MYIDKIVDERQFKKELTELKNDNIIIFEDGGYYIPNKKEELQEFIKKHNKQNYNMVKMINLAYEMLEEMEKNNG